MSFCWTPALRDLAARARELAYVVSAKESPEQRVFRMRRLVQSLDPSEAALIKEMLGREQAHKPE